MIVNATVFRIMPNYEPSIEMAIKWHQKSDGKWVGSDRGYVFDIHRGTFTIFGEKSALIDLITYMNANRSGFFIELQKGEEIFGPHIKIDTSMEVVVEDYGKLKKANMKMYEMDITFKLLSPYDYFIEDDVISTPDLIPDLLYEIKDVKQSFVGDRDWEVRVLDIFQQEAAVISDKEDGEVGTLDIDLRYIDSGVSLDNDMGLIIKGFLTKIRTFPMQYPGNKNVPISGPDAGKLTWGGIENPFGFKVENYPYLVKVLEFKLKKPFRNVWDLSLKLAEAN